MQSVTTRVPIPMDVRARFEALRVLCTFLGVHIDEEDTLRTLHIYEPEAGLRRIFTEIVGQIPE